MADINKSIVYKIEVDDKGKVKIDGLTKGFVKMDAAVNKLTADLKAQQAAMGGVTKDGLNPMIDKTGLAGATIVELGRTISDANYGIRGIANNLSQLSTLMITLITTTGGFANGMKALWNTMKGPLGLIVAFQIVIALLERFDMQSKKTTKEVDNITASTAAAGSNLKILKDVMDDSTLSTEELERAVNKANLEYKDLNIQIDENGRVTEESRKQIDEKILSLERLAKALAIQKEIERVFTEITKSQLDEEKALQAEEDKRSQLEAQRIQQRNQALQGGIGAMGEAVETIILRNKEAVRERFKEQREEFTNELNILRNILLKEDLVDELFKGKDGSKRGGKRRREKILELFGVGSDLPNALKESAQRGVDELFFIGEKYDEWVQKNLDSLKAFIKLIRNEAKDVSELFKAGQQTLQDVGGVFLSFSNARMEALARERDYVLHSGNLSAAQQKKAIADIEKREIKAQERKIKLERDLFTIKQSMFIAEEIMKAKFFAAEQIRIAQTAVANQTATSQQIALEGVAQIGKANMSIGAFMSALGPLGLPTFILTIGGALASILAARKKAQSALSALGAPSARGGGGGGLGVEAPDFNVVGASPESQLAQSVSQQQTQPLRAFVVHKDIKNANDLDRTITTTSSLG